HSGHVGLRFGQRRSSSVEIRSLQWDNARMKNVWLIVVVLAFTSGAVARDKHLPLPPQIATAKTVFIDNQSGFAKLGDRAYEQLTKWGRFQVILDRKKADLILLLSARAYDGGYVTTGGGTTGTIDESGNINTTNNPTYTSQVSVSYTF